ncbi:iron-sulfur assembly protein IscA-like 2, mitochondrial [Acrasis kona]|uniref:Iron-sulfur assembly protein IscA-like 2, mitochondrial n=1 Tax=Acrasis kona TaxID=1008807 RepID=A0AAW2Z6K0_9EUKA
MMQSLMFRRGACLILRSRAAIPVTRMDMRLFSKSIIPLQAMEQTTTSSILKDNEQYIAPEKLQANKDAEGIHITNECAERIKYLNEKRGSERHLRVVVNGGGCQGFLIEFNMDQDSPQEDDILFTKDGAKIVVDQTSLDLIRGATLDFEVQMSKASFSIKDNPNASNSCSCGSSFAA